MGGFLQGAVQGYQNQQHANLQGQQMKAMADYHKTLGKHMDALTNMQETENQIKAVQLQRMVQQPGLAAQLFGMPGQQTPDTAGVPNLTSAMDTTQAPSDPSMGGVPAQGLPSLQAGGQPIQQAPAPQGLSVRNPSPGTPQALAAAYLRPGELEQFQQIAEADPGKAIELYLARLGEKPTEHVLKPGEKLVATRGGQQVGSEVSGGPPTPTVHQVTNPDGSTQFVGVTPTTGEVSRMGEPLPGIKQPQDKYANVQPDGQGGFIGINRQNWRMEPIPSAAGVRSSGQLTPEARSAAAIRYNVDGTLPPNLGRGAQGAANTAAILNEAAQLSAAAGQTGEAQRITQLANKASATALSQLASQEAKMRAFEGTFRRNVDLAESLSLKVDRSGTPIFNAWKQAGQRAVAGNPDITAFDTAIKSVVNEFAKITTSATGGGQTSEQEIAKMEALLKAAQTPKQFHGVIQVMRKETQNRLDAFQEEKTRLRGSMGGARQEAAASPGSHPDMPKGLTAKQQELWTKTYLAGAGK